MATEDARRSIALRRATRKTCQSCIGYATAVMALSATLSATAFADTPVSGMTALTAGTYHTCAVTANGGAQCWGVNDYGQRGDGRSVVFQSTPVDVIGLPSGVTAISAGDVHTCAATATGVDCWGRGYYGELGDGAGVSRMTPVHVVGIGPGVKGIATGPAHSCAITASSGVKCWGANDVGQLGDGSLTKQLTPVDVSGLGSGVSAIAAGGVHTCALTASGAVKCWGRTTIGQPIEPTPTDVPGLGSGVVAISVGGDHACAVLATGDARCWGLNDHGELGDGTVSSSTVPVAVVGMGVGVRAIAAAGGDAGFHTCALTVVGGVKCWGYGLVGEVGDGTFAERHTPVDVIGLASGATAIATGRYHSCALTVGGGIQCWGSNLSAQIGDNSQTLRLVPTRASLGTGATAIAAGHRHTCAVTTSGAVKCWGEGWAGQIGDNASITRLVPTDVAGLASGIVGVSAGETSSCVSTAAGGAKCWGLGWFGQLGNGTFVDHPAPADVVDLATAVQAITVGRWHACAVLAGGQPKCWGSGGFGQLGVLPPVYAAPLPMNVVGLSSGVVALRAGNVHTCAVIGSGGVKCWGDNIYGQIGDGTHTTRTTPVDVVGLGATAAAIVAGHYHTCALTSGGGAKCWGSNVTGSLGDGSTVNRAAPVDVFGLGNGAIAIAAGWGHTCAITTGGGVKCWGLNDYGQLGDNSTTNRTTPVDVVGLSGAIVITAGFSHTCALTASGAVLCWGQNEAGQLGNGEGAAYPYPRNVVYAVNAIFQTEVPALDSSSIVVLILLLLGSGIIRLRNRTR